MLSAEVKEGDYMTQDKTISRDEFIYGLKACGCTVKDGQTYYEEQELIKCFDDLYFNQELDKDVPDNNVGKMDGDRAVSLKEVLKIQKKHYIGVGDYRQQPATSEILQLPSVSQPKTGHWKSTIDGKPICSECDFISESLDGYFVSNFCPNCGCRMVEPQESEVNSMDRLISEQEVLKAFEKYLRFEGNFHEMIKAIPSADEDEWVKRLDVLKIVDKCISESQWIPVSERLPEKNMRCLVAVGRYNFTQIAMYSDLMGIIDHQIFYQGYVGHDSFKNITQYVKAWMPLPQPYDPQESEDKE